MKTIWFPKGNKDAKDRLSDSTKTTSHDFRCLSSNEPIYLYCIDIIYRPFIASDYLLLVFMLSWNH